MEEIKFRAWNKDQMLTMPLDGVFGLARFFGFLSKSAKLMQFTGLKDKNGKDLDWWESDLISSPSSRVIYEIFWRDSEGQWYARRINFNDGSHPPRPLFWYVDRSLEVIGNIHENKKLLD